MSDNLDTVRHEAALTAEDDARQFLTFTIGQEEYGVDIMTVREIKGWTETTRLPNTPDFMRGVMNLRGLIIPIFDLRMRFQQILTEATAKHVIIILAMAERNIGILVDTVSDILDASASEIKPAPSQQENAQTRCVDGLISHDNRMVVLLDVEKLFDTRQIDAIQTNAA